MKVAYSFVSSPDQIVEAFVLLPRDGHNRKMMGRAT
jgi:hypothetical protein